MTTELATCTGTSYESSCSSLRNKLGMRKVCSKFILRVITTEQKAACVEMCQWLLEMTEHNATLFSRIIKGNESWIVKYDPSTKCQTMQ